MPPPTDRSRCAHAVSHARCGARQIERRVVSSQIHQAHLQSPPRRQPAKLAKQRRRVAGGGREVKRLGPQPGDHAIVDDDSRLIEHDAVPGHADLQIGEAGRVHPLEEFGGVGAVNLHLAERTHIDHADLRAHRARPRPRSPPRATYRQPRNTPDGANCRQASIPRRAPRARNPTAYAAPARSACPQDARAAPDGTSAARSSCPAPSIGSPRTCARIRSAFMFECFPWLGPMPIGGETLQQLAAVESFLAGVHQVLHLDVFIEVDEFLAVGMRENRISVCRALEQRKLHLARGLRRPGRALRLRSAPAYSPSATRASKEYAPLTLPQAYTPGASVWRRIAPGGLVHHPRAGLVQQRVGRSKPDTHPEAIELDFPAARGCHPRSTRKQAADLAARRERRPRSAGRRSESERRGGPTRPRPVWRAVRHSGRRSSTATTSTP